MLYFICYCRPNSALVTILYIFDAISEIGLFQSFHVYVIWMLDDNNAR